MSLGNEPLTCDRCRHWKPSAMHKPFYNFVARLEKQLGREVTLGWCMASGEEEGPTVDGDTCPFFHERKMCCHRQRKERP